MLSFFTVLQPKMHSSWPASLWAILIATRAWWRWNNRSADGGDVKACFPLHTFLLPWLWKLKNFHSQNLVIDLCYTANFALTSSTSWAPHKERFGCDTCEVLISVTVLQVFLHFMWYLMLNLWTVALDEEILMKWCCIWHMHTAPEGDAG